MDHAKSIIILLQSEMDSHRLNLGDQHMICQSGDSLSDAGEMSHPKADPIFFSIFVPPGGFAASTIGSFPHLNLPSGPRS